MRNKRWWFWLLVFALALGVVWMLRVRVMAAAYARPPASVDEVWGLVRRNDFYLRDGGKQAEDERRAIQAMLSAVDPYAYYVPSRVAAMMRAERPSGMLVDVDEGGRLVVQAVWPGSGAAAGGVRPGDWIVALDGHIIGTPPDRFERLRADFLPPSGEERVVVQRAGKRLTLALRYRPFLPVEESAPGARYVRPFLWLHGTGAAFRRAVCETGERRLVIDLRGNGGGDPWETAEGLSALLPAGTAVAEMRNREGRVVLRVATEKAPCYHGEVAVLVDGETASSSEVFAGVLQRAGRAVLIGSSTYGKGVWQSETRLLGGGGYVMLTEGRWYFADETNIDGVGLRPDIFWSGGDWEDALKVWP